ncbi:MAG: LpqN/LpqT family lipoprotein [Segniliparus sp.]|uniref:LpqN/LpqT family lipoprotein n=1 Tax=Segniliparus sp. TaxID=2804064 RepID=UPI003F2CA03A
MFAFREASAMLLAFGAALSGCSADEQALTAPSTPVAARTPASDMTLDQYLQSHAVSVQALTPADDSTLRVSLQQPSGWLAYDGQQIPNTYVVLTNRRAIDQSFAPNAVVIVHKLNGDFDQRAAILRGFVDTEKYKDFRRSNASLDDFDGHPSAVIEGSYNDDKGRALHVLNRYTIAGSGDRQFIVLLSVTTTEGQAGQLAGDLKALDQGLRVGVR